jgi:hypothetical protein
MTIRELRFYQKTRMDSCHWKHYFTFKKENNEDGELMYKTKISLRNGRVNRMSEIKFWLDSWKKTLIVLHIKSNKKKEISNQREIKRFLFVYGLSEENLKGVQEGLDLLGYFR